MYRVVASFTKATAAGSIVSASYYNYDINGNVKTLWQENSALNTVSASGNGIKQIDYNFDLVSGKVNKVSYQPGKGDQFFHKYLYDAENRLTDVYTSRDELIWQQDAFYRYYLHGPLARTELGQRKVQGLDYAYTLQGWLKGVNGTSVNAQYDMGRDNYQNASEYNHSTVSRDVFSFDLNYFNTDFRPIGTSVAQFRNPFYNYANETSLVGKQLFNGNIKSMSVALDQFGLNHYSYRYDQLNRLMEKRSFYDDFGLQEYNDYNESFTYDANGNILSAVKSASEGSPGGVNMDILGYQYLPGSNKLDYVTDQVSASAHANDVDGQLSNNYTYDNIGNLISDVQESIVSISWTVYGKINSILKQNASTGKETNIQYQYDPSGNRVYKNVTQRNIGVTGQDVIDHTYYVRDAQGNVMSTYTKHEEPANNISLKWAEQHLYGSSSLGLMNLNMDIPTQPMVPASGQTMDDDLFTGQYVYELTNHLGNVMATISDKKLFSNIVVPDGGGLDFYYPEVLSETDYYAFGQEIKDKSYRLTGTYRYGFNGKENDNEVKGEGNQQDYGMRIYDPRIGRFLSRDPISSNYPMLTPYQFASNSSISGIDLDGLEYYYAADGAFIAKARNNNTQVRIIKAENLAAVWQLLRRKEGAITTDLNKLSNDVGMTNGELNTRAFLSTLKQTENGGNAALGYNSKHGFTNGKVNTFTDKTYDEAPEDYKDHPYSGKAGSSAAGAYQILKGSWKNENDKQVTNIRAKYNITDFSPLNQDKMVLGLINDKRHSLALIIEGDIHGAIERLKNEWSSLPGASQSHIDIPTFDKLFQGNVSNEINDKSNLAVKKGETLKAVKPN